MRTLTQGSGKNPQARLAWPITTRDFTTLRGAKIWRSGLAWVLPSWTAKPQCDSNLRLVLLQFAVRRESPDAARDYARRVPAVKRIGPLPASCNGGTPRAGCDAGSANSRLQPTCQSSSSAVQPGENRPGEKRDQDLVVPREREPAPAPALRRALDHVDARPVVLDLVQVHGREAVERAAQVDGHGERLEENLGQDHGRAEGHVHGHRHAEPVTGVQQRKRSVRRVRGLERAAQRLAEAFAPGAPVPG